MMAYENNTFNNAPFADAFEPMDPAQMEGKLTSTSSFPWGEFSAPIQAGFVQQSQNFNQNCNGMMQQQQQQSINCFANMQMQMNAQANLPNNGNIAMQPYAMTMSAFQPTTLMNSMRMSQPFFQNAVQEQDQARGVPNMITFNNRDNYNVDTPLPTLSSYEPNDAFSSVEKPYFGNLEPLPMFEKPSKELSNSEPAKGSIPSSTSISRPIGKSKHMLPADFQPSDYHVICGNKRKYFESKGNAHFREVCKLLLEEYVQAPTKIEKSGVVTKVMNILRQDCPEGAFVTPQGGRWYAVSERTAREKVGTFMRDCLGDSYKSSAKNKIARRKIIKKVSASANNSATENTNQSDDASLESISFYDVDDLTPVPL
jgi:hypothetical protein